MNKSSPYITVIFYLIYLLRGISAGPQTVSIPPQITSCNLSEEETKFANLKINMATNNATRSITKIILGEELTASWTCKCTDILVDDQRPQSCQKGEINKFPPNYYYDLTYAPISQEDSVITLLNLMYPISESIYVPEVHVGHTISGDLVWDSVICESFDTPSTTELLSIYIYI